MLDDSMTQRNTQIVNEAISRIIAPTLGRRQRGPPWVLPASPPSQPKGGVVAASPRYQCTLDSGWLRQYPPFPTSKISCLICMRSSRFLCCRPVVCRKFSQLSSLDRVRASVRVYWGFCQQLLLVYTMLREPEIDIYVVEYCA